MAKKVEYFEMEMSALSLSEHRWEAAFTDEPNSLMEVGATQDLLFCL